MVLWSRGAQPTKPGWSKPHTHSNPTNLALFRHKITLYRFNQGGLILLQGLKWEQGGWAPRAPLTLTTGNVWIVETVNDAGHGERNKLAVDSAGWLTHIENSDWFSNRKMRVVELAADDMTMWKWNRWRCNHCSCQIMSDQPKHDLDGLRTRPCRYLTVKVQSSTTVFLTNIS